MISRCMIRLTLCGIGLALVLLLGGCATTGPTPFELGDEAPPPYGCIEGRMRGVDC